MSSFFSKASTILTKSSLACSFKILSSQVATKEWTKSSQTKVLFLKEGSVLSLNFFSVDHVILILSSNWFVKIVFLTDLESFIDFVCIPVAGSPIECKTLFDDFMKSSNDFLNWACIVKTVGIDNVNIIKLESLEGSLNTFLNVLSAGIVI